MDPNQLDPEDPNAATDPSAAEQYEGAPAASAAPDDDLAPEDEAPEQIDWQVIADERERRAVAAEQQAQALATQQQQMALQVAEAAWEQERQQAHAYARTLDYEQHDKYLEQYYGYVDQRRKQQYAQAVAPVYINAQADRIMGAYGLAPEDRVRLGSDPNQMEAIAHSIASERQRYQAEREADRAELKKLKRQMQANQALSNPAYRQGGARPGTNAPGNVDPNDMSQWKRALGIPEGR